MIHQTLPLTDLSHASWYHHWGPRTLEIEHFGFRSYVNQMRTTIEKHI